MKKLSDITVDSLKKHQQRFGSDGVIETAVSCYHSGDFTLANVIEVQEFLDAKRKRTPWEKGKRLTVETRVKRLLGIEDESDD